MNDKIKLLFTLIQYLIFKVIQGNNIKDSHWSWYLYPSKNMKYFANKYGSVEKAYIELI